MEKTAAATRQASAVTKWSRAAFDSRAASFSRLSRNCGSNATSAPRVWSRPACPAGLRNGMGRPTIEPSLTTEDQAQDKPDAERGKDRLGRVFAHVLFGILLKTADATARIDRKSTLLNS